MNMPAPKKKRVIKKKAKTVPVKTLGTGMLGKAAKKTKSAMQRRCEKAGLRWNAKTKSCS